MGGKKPLELTGQRFGLLTVIQKSEINKHGNTHWVCVCDCGNKSVVNGVRLVNGHTKSCGCLKSKSIIQRNKDRQIGEVGRQKNRIYRIYYGMLSRCYNSNDTEHYKNYGARGISVCEDWRNSFETFENWALNNGYSDELSIDRIDNDGNYEPSNCQWVDNKTQSNNRRTNRSITYDGKTQTISQWSEETGISKNAIFARLRKGWSEKDAITIPNGQYRGGINHSHLSV